MRIPILRVLSCWELPLVRRCVCLVTSSPAATPTNTLVQVSVNDLIMIFAYAPIVALLLGVTDIPVPWDTLLLSVLLYVVVPLGAGYFTRKALVSGSRTDKAVADFTAKLKPLSVIGLLATVVLLFGFQGGVILSQPLLIALIAAPLLLQSYGIFAVAYAAAWVMKVPFRIAAPCALIGTSNFFELAVAVAIGLFGLNSGAALATGCRRSGGSARDAVAGCFCQSHPPAFSRIREIRGRSSTAITDESYRLFQSR